MPAVELVVEWMDGDSGRGRAAVPLPGVAWVDKVPDLGDCRAALQAVLDHPMLPARSGQRPVRWTFSLARDAQAMDEHNLCHHAARHPELHPLLHALLQGSAAGAHGDRPWASDELPTGSVAAFALASHDRGWLPAYLEFLRQCDLDHEVDQGGELDSLVEQYGWAADTCALVAARLGSCSGQWGDEQVGRWLEEAGLGDYLAGEAGQAAMLAAARAEFDHDGSWARALRQAPEPAFEGELRYSVDLFAPCLTPASLAGLEAHVRAQWTGGPVPA